MRTVKLILSFDGTSFSGWQRQKTVLTVQQVLEESISVMTGEESIVHGAGRTDAGVHALAMTAHFITESSIPCQGFLKGLNSILPEDVRIISVENAYDTFHSRFNAVGKTYYYNFITSSLLLPTERLYNAHLRFQGAFDFTAVSECLDILIGKHDFTSFEASGSRDIKKEGGLGAVREIFTAKFVDRAQAGHYRIEISGSGFLRHMVRNIIGTLFEVGLAKRSVNGFVKALQGKDRSLAGPTAPAKGLFLKEVFY